MTLSVKAIAHLNSDYGFDIVSKHKSHVTVNSYARTHIKIYQYLHVMLYVISEFGGKTALLISEMM